MRGVRTCSRWRRSRRSRSRSAASRRSWNVSSLSSRRFASTASILRSSSIICSFFASSARLRCCSSYMRRLVASRILALCWRSISSIVESTPPPAAPCFFSAPPCSMISARRLTSVDTFFRRSCRPARIGQARMGGRHVQARFWAGRAPPQTPGTASPPPPGSLRRRQSPLRAWAAGPWGGRRSRPGPGRSAGS